MVSAGNLALPQGSVKISELAARIGDYGGWMNWHEYILLRDLAICRGGRELDCVDFRLFARDRNLEQRRLRGMLRSLRGGGQPAAQ